MSDIEKCRETAGVNCTSPHGCLDCQSSVQSCNCLATRSSTLSSTNSEHSSSDHEFPEGTRAWMTVFGAFVALFCTFGQMNAFGTFQTWYAAHQLNHLPASTISWIGSLQLWVFFFSGGPIGRAFDAFGPYVLMISGTTIYIFSIMMTSLATQYYQYILSQGILFGLGVALLFYPSLASISTHFSKYRGTALGIAVSGSSLGGVIFPILLQLLFDKVGFGWTVRIAGLISAVGCVVAILTVTSHFPPRRISAPWFDTKSWTDARFTLLAAGSCFVALGIFIPLFYIVDYAHHLAISPHMAFYTLAAMNAGGVLGRIAPAYVSDAIGHFNILTPSAFLCGLTCLVFWLFSKSLISLMLFAATYGFFSGAFISVITPCVAKISDIREIGTRMGMLYSIISFPSLLGGPAAGALLVLGHGSYTGMIVFSGSIIITGSLFILGSKLKVDSRIFARV